MKVRQTDFMQTGAAVVVLDKKEYLIPLFTSNIIGELGTFLKERLLDTDYDKVSGFSFSELTEASINAKSIYEFFNPKDKSNKKFKLTLNSMEALRTGITRKRNSNLMCIVNRESFPSYYE